MPSGFNDEKDYGQRSYFSDATVSEGRSASDWLYRDSLDGAAQHISKIDSERSAAIAETLAKLTANQHTDGRQSQSSSLSPLEPLRYSPESVRSQPLLQSKSSSLSPLESAAPVNLSASRTVTLARKALPVAKKVSDALLKFVASKPWVPVAIGAVVGFAVGGGPPGAVIGALTGLLAGEAVRQYVKRQTRKQGDRSNTDTPTGRIAASVGTHTTQSAPGNLGRNKPLPRIRSTTSLRMQVATVDRSESAIRTDIAGHTMAAAAFLTPVSKAAHPSRNQEISAAYSPAHPTVNVQSQNTRRRSSP